MPKFIFQAQTSSKQVVNGLMEANDEYDLKNKLKSKGLVPLRVIRSTRSEKGSQRQLNPFSQRVPSRELQIYTRQFSTLINAGIPITDSIKILSEGKKNALLKSTSLSVLQMIESGKSLADSMSNFPNVFDRLYINMVRAGEEGGILDLIFNRMSIYLEKTEKIKKQVIGALFYPAVIIFVAALVVTGILVFIIPKFQELYKSNHQELPALTQMVVDMSNFLVNNWYIVIAFVIITPLAMIYYYRTPTGKDTVDRILIRTPLFGELILKSSIARMSRTLSTLLNSGVPMIEALEIAARTSGNRVMEDILFRSRDSVIGGRTLTAPLLKEKLIPDMVSQMISIGEQSGTLDTMLGKIADFYEDDVENVVKALTSMIEPILMVFLGGIIAFLVIAMYLPIFNMAGSGMGG